MDLPALLRQLRFNPAIATCLYWTARPIFDVSGHLRAQIASKLRRNGGAITYDGIGLRFPRNVGTGFISSICWHGVDGFEPHTWATLRALLKDAGTFLDVGSNIGFYAVLAKKISPTVEVIAFEPVPTLCAGHRLFCQANGVPGNVHQLALSDTNGTARFYRPTEDDAVDESSAGTITAASWQARRSHTEIIVQTTTLDEFLMDKTLKQPVVIN